MTQSKAGTTQRGFFSRDDDIAPLPLPTGQNPRDGLNIIWRRNEVCIDIGNYSLGSAAMLVWAQMMTFVGIYAIDPHPYIAIGGLLIAGIPALMLLNSLRRPIKMPVRFNRQRREVCVPISSDEYWIVPWETVTAAATQQSSLSRAGKTTMGLLIVGFKNPDPNAEKGNTDYCIGFSCGGGETAMALWECMRSYMEIGLHTLPEGNDFEGGRDNLKGRGVIWGTLCFYAEGIRDHLVKGEIGKALWLFSAIFLFGGPLVFMLQTWKLSPPPDLLYPYIIQWSKPLPPEQWAQRSPELEVAIAERELELAAQKAEVCA